MRLSPSVSKSETRQESEQGRLILQALATSALGGGVKRLSSARRTSISAIYKIIEGEVPSWPELGVEWLACCLAEPTKSRQDALAPLLLMCRLFGLRVVDEERTRAQGVGLAAEAANLALESGEGVSKVIRALEDGITPDECSSIESTMSRLIETAHRTIREAQAAVAKHGPRRVGEG